MKDLAGVFVQFFAFVNVLDEFVCHQDYDLINVQSQVKGFHFVLNLEEVAFKDLFDVSDVNRNVSDLFHLVPIHFWNLGEVLFNQLVQAVDKGFDWLADETKLGKKLLWKSFLFLSKINVFSKTLLNGKLKALPDTLNDVFAVLSCVNDPTYSLLEGLGLFGFVKALVGIVPENSFHYSKNI